MTRDEAIIEIKAATGMTVDRSTRLIDIQDCYETMIGEKK